MRDGDEGEQSSRDLRYHSNSPSRSRAQTSNRASRASPVEQPNPVYTQRADGRARVSRNRRACRRARDRSSTLAQRGPTPHVQHPSLGGFRASAVAHLCSEGTIGGACARRRLIATYAKYRSTATEGFRETGHKATDGTATMDVVKN